MIDKINIEILNKRMFELQRFNILQAKLNPVTESFISDSYAFAWNVRMYPLSNSGDIAEIYADCFCLKESVVEKIATYVDEEWCKGKYYTFYGLETYFKKNISTDELGNENDIRTVLINILKYYFLRGGFDDKFWSILLKEGEYPIEAKVITRPFDTGDICLC